MGFYREWKTWDKEILTLSKLIIPINTSLLEERPCSLLSFAWATRFTLVVPFTRTASPGWEEEASALLSPSFVSFVDSPSFPSYEQMAQIEDIVKRTTEITIENITISTLKIGSLISGFLVVTSSVGFVISWLLSSWFDVVSIEEDSIWEEDSTCSP